MALPLIRRFLTNAQRRGVSSLSSDRIELAKQTIGGLQRCAAGFSPVISHKRLAANQWKLLGVVPFVVATAFIH
jgi:hypothetical protein